MGITNGHLVDLIPLSLLNNLSCVSATKIYGEPSFRFEKAWSNKVITLCYSTSGWT